MPALRRAYLYLTAAISLQVTVWAAISLLRAYLAPDADPVAANLALQIAVLVVATPIFVLHWRQADKLAAADPAERASTGRQLYAYGMALLFLVPALMAVHNLLLLFLGQALTPPPIEAGRRAAQSLVSLVVLAGMLLWQRQLLRADLAAPGVARVAAPFRRLFTVIFTAAGLVMWTGSTGGLISWLLTRFDSAPGALPAPAGEALAEMVATVVVGVLLWAFFWRRLGAEAIAGPAAGRGAVLPAVFVHLALLGSAVAALGGGALLLIGSLRAALSLPPRGDYRGPLSAIIVGGLVWAYHHRVRGAALAAVDREDADSAAAGDGAETAMTVPDSSDRSPAATPTAVANLRAWYPYAMAILGMGAALAGLSAVVNILIRALAGMALVDSSREQLAWGAAVLLMGLPLWALVWRQVQPWALLAGPAGDRARGAIPRKLYLYLYLLVGTLSFLIAAVYLIYRVVGRALGGVTETDPFGLDLAEAGAMALIAAGAWLLHLNALRGDGDLAERSLAGRLAAWPTALLGAAHDAASTALEAALRRELPDLPLTRLDAAGADAATLGAAALLIVPASLVMGGDALAAAIAAAPGRKLYLPAGSAAAGSADWVGVEPWSAEDLAEHLARAVNQVAEGHAVTLRRPLSVGVMIAVGIAAAILLGAIGVPLWLFFDRLV